LQELEGQLGTVLDSARAPSTTSLYKSAWIKWQNWTIKHNVCSLPAEPRKVALYLLHVNNVTSSFSSVKLAYSAISWKHSISGLASPTSNSIVVEVIAGLKRQLARPVRKKEPFSISDMNSLYKQLIPGCLTDLRNTCMLLIAFYGFLRCEELVHITCSNVRILAEHVELHIANSKCDQLRLGETVVISKFDSSCPVELLSKYFDRIEAQDTPNLYLFRRVIFRKGHKFIDPSNKAISYSNVRDIVKAKAGQLGLDPLLYSTHSLRAGGSTAAANAGISDRLFQRHGRWSSAASKDGYIKDSLESRLSVSKALH
jgi:integrase